MIASDIFEKLWVQYASENPSAGKIFELFQKSGEQIINDHVAFRTFDDPRVNIDVIARPFIDAGYVAKGEYLFEVKKLRARHYELPGEPESPRVFISELILKEFSEDLQKTVKDFLDAIPRDHLNAPDHIFKGALSGSVNYETYKRLRDESEYAAWLYLNSFEGIEAVNTFLKESGFVLNSSGGEIKGSPEELLEQSSTLADRVEVSFEEGVFVVPSCYYEFARRYKDQTGKLFSAFIAGSADKIFESTNFR